jgi:hypothetical protein
VGGLSVLVEYSFAIVLQSKCHGDNVANSFVTNTLQQYCCVTEQYILAETYEIIKSLLDKNKTQ